MKKIRNFTEQMIHLEGFGAITIKEDFDGIWSLDLFPTGHQNDDKMLRMETVLKGYGDRYFQNIDTIREKLNAENEMDNL